jgi:hypothetical protein
MDSRDSHRGFLAFGSASAFFRCTKEAATQRNDLHYLFQSPFPEALLRPAKRLLLLPILNPTKLDLFEMWPQRWGRFFSRALLTPLEDPPDKVGQQREDQQHEYASDPDQEVQRHFWRIDVFLIHASR